MIHTLYLYLDLATGLKTNFQRVRRINRKIFLFFLTVAAYLYFDQKTRVSLDFFILSIFKISDNPVVLTQGIFGLRFKVFLKIIAVLV